MKNQIKSMLIVFLLFISITGCSSAKKSLDTNNNNSTNGNEISKTSVPTSPTPTILDSINENTETQIPSNNSGLEAYKAVLQNKTEFFSTDNNKKLCLNDFLTNKENYDTIFNVTHFTVLDMEDGKVVVLELSVGDQPEFYEILHYANDTVYGYLIVYRGLEQLKADGTFLYSSGAADNGIGKLKFESDTLETDILGYSKSNQSDDKLVILYSIHNQPVTKELFDAFVNEQLEKKDVIWHEFSQKNMEEIFGL
ncbi:hypothetical protein [Lachnoclostridium phytofermentans]|uniref:Lipoprotein n=1 Tax=Lachnoclostridium phytofermentans (strain ATCC 700394 / DSM 18823 / ISDg) TaxID=357809 RepID=A9KPA1_LACP7|nr:hypothetical protein [Lachnoclostridium phytofermentans]ABX41763.1 hypothetical protein Cphy_1388 [Lachnoclostridium phytofermentans ISDg]